MAGFTLGVIVALFVGGWLGQLRGRAKGRRGDYVKAKDGMPGLRKAAREAVAHYFVRLVLIAVVVGALVYGLMMNENGS